MTILPQLKEPSKSMMGEFSDRKNTIPFASYAISGDVTLASERRPYEKPLMGNKITISRSHQLPIEPHLRRSRRTLILVLDM